VLLQSMLDKPAAPGWERESLYEGVGVCVHVWYVHGGRGRRTVLAYNVYQKWDDYNHAFAIL